MPLRSNRRAVKLHRNYTADEAARVLGVSKGTVRRWVKNGLPALTERRPILILGRDLIAFLDKRAARRAPCNPDECYCFSCRAPRKAAFGAVEYMPITATGGNVRALCAECSTVMHKRISKAQLAALSANLDVTIMQAHEPLSDSHKPCVNDHLEAETDHHA